jgi:hypothetical protein
MTRKDYRILQNYHRLRKGRNAYEREVRNLLMNHKQLWELYALKAGEPAYCSVWGGGFTARPDTSKIEDTFLEDLVTRGILEKLSEVEND